MRVVGQLAALVPGSDRRLDGNAYLGLFALMGAIGWGATAYVVHFLSPPPEGVVTLAELGAWAEETTAHSWKLMGLWVGLVAGFLAVMYLRGNRGVLLTIPSITWTVGIVVALALNAAGLAYDVMVLIWLPWFALYAVGYLVTGVMITRGGIYLLAALVSGFMAIDGLAGHLTNTGHMVVTLDPMVETPLAGAVMFPMPYTYVVLGVLHVVPLGIDALRGGRQMTDDGVPKVRQESDDTPESEEDEEPVGGVVPD